MRKVLKLSGLIVVVILAIALITVALNYTYLKRTITGQDIEHVREVEWYQPQVKMVPSADVLPLIRSENLSDQDQVFADAIAYAEEINSSAFLVYQSGELVVEKYWQPYNSNSYTQTQSVHKSLLSLAVGIAIEEGDIGSVNDPVSNYLGARIDQSMGEIRIEHLLNMSSGLGKDPVGFFLFEHFLRLLNSTDISKVAQSLPQKIAPGQEFEYINNNPQLLVDVLEAATGQSYEHYLQEKIWSKIAANPGYLWMDRENGTPHGYCCLIALPEDLLRIGLLVLNDGQVNGEQVVSEDWIARAIAPSELNPNYGYLIWRGSPHTSFRKYSASSDFGVQHSQPYLAEDLIYFDGFGGQRVYIVPSRDLVIVRVGETRFDFDDSALPNHVLSSLDKTSGGSETYEISHADLAIDTAHSGPVQVRIAYPLAGLSEDSSNSQYPLILFSHGHYLTNQGYDNLIDAWAAQGYVVAAPLHLDTGDIPDVQALGEKLGSDWISAARILDMMAVADQMETISQSLAGFEATIDTDQIIAAGHSYGALTAQTMAGAELDVLGNSVYPIPDTLRDERVIAVVAVSPPGLAPGFLSEESWSTLDKPQLVVTGTKDYFEHLWTDYRTHLVSYQTAQPEDNYVLVLEGMDHYFGNLIGRLELETPPQQLALESFIEASLQFMGAYLNEDGTEIADLKVDSTILELDRVLRYEHR